MSESQPIARFFIYGRRRRPVRFSCSLLLLSAPAANRMPDDRVENNRHYMASEFDLGASFSERFV
jgi:hypothetical protein